MDRRTYELRLTRRDGQRMRHEPRPVTETFDLERELDEIVGKHFVWMAAAAEQRDVRPHQKIWEFQDWLPQYQVEVWRTDGYWKEPEVVSTSTHGWKD